MMAETAVGVGISLVVCCTMGCVVFCWSTGSVVCGRTCVVVWNTAGVV